MKIISREMPRFGISWWAMGLGLSLFVIPTLRATNALPDNWNITWGQLNVIPALIFPLLILALITNTAAYRKGERSYILWVGIIPTILFAILMIAEIVSAIFGLGF